MTRDEIINKAMHIEELDAELIMPDALLYWRVLGAALLYKLGNIPRKSATEYKQAAIQQYNRDLTQYNNGMTAMMDKAVLYKKLELAVSDYLKNRTLETADRVIYLLYGILPKGSAL